MSSVRVRRKIRTQIKRNIKSKATKASQFKSGFDPRRGRGPKPRSPEQRRHSREVVDSIIEAACILGGKDQMIGYFLRLHAKDFRLFAHMVERVIPLVHKVTTDLRVAKFSREEIMRELAARGIDVATVKTLELSPKEFKRDEPAPEPAPDEPADVAPGPPSLKLVH